MRPPDAPRPPAAAPAGGQDVEGHRRDQGTAWLAAELAGIAEMVHAAHLSAQAGHAPAVHIRRAAVRLAALDAAVGDDLRVTRAEPEAVAP